MGSGESGLPFYNSQKLLQIINHAWSDTPFGNGGSVGYSAWPFYYVVSILQNIGIPSYLLQALMYWFIFVVGTLSVHKLAGKFSGNTVLTRMGSALFYIFNPIVHVSVLHRFQYPMIFFYGFIPLAFLIYYSGLKARRLSNLIVLNIVGLIFGFIFVGPAFMELSFAVFGLLSLFYFVLFAFRKRFDPFPILYLAFYFFIFFLVNIWWLVPFLSSLFLASGQYGSLNFFNPSGNVETFKAISRGLESILSVVRMVPAHFYDTNGSSWGWIYGTWFFVFLSLYPVIAFTLGLFSRKRGVLFRYLVILSFITMFLMKGSLRPFGGVSLLIIKFVTFAQVFRNPFEKIGLLLPFAMAIPVGFGTEKLINTLSLKFKRSRLTIAVVLFIVFFPVYMFPIVNGYVFTGGGIPSDDLKIGQYVKVPDYYKDARQWLNKQSGLFRVLALPLDGEGMTYKWDYGYSGTELSNNIFDQSFISFSTGQNFLEGIAEGINRILYYYPKNFLSLAQIFNIKYIMVRDDINNLARETQSSEALDNVVKTDLKDHFSKIAHFGKLTFYEIKPEDYNKRIFADTSLTFVTNTQKKDYELIPSSGVENKGLVVFSPEVSQQTPFFSYANGLVIQGTFVEKINLDFSKEPLNLPFTRFNRESKFYKLVRLKENAQTFFLTSGERILNNSFLLGKRLSEIRQDHLGRKEALNEYNNSLSALQKDIRSSNFFDRQIAVNLINQRKAFQDLLGEDNAIVNEVKQSISEINKILEDMYFKSIYITENTAIYRFSVPLDGNYDVILPNVRWDEYYQSIDTIKVQIDDKEQTVKTSNNVQISQMLNLGNFHLKQGIHEISVFNPVFLNLISVPETGEMIFSSQNREDYIKTFPVINLDIYSTYKLSFEYFIEKGNGPIVSVNQDSDPVNKDGKKVPRIETVLARNDYDFGWKTYQSGIILTPSTKEWNISFKILPYGDCKSAASRIDRPYCSDNEFSKRFLKDSTVRVRSLKLERVFTNPIILKSTAKFEYKGAPPEISFDQINPSLYKVNIKDAKSPFFLTLSTSFDPQWRTYFLNPQPERFIDKVTETVPGSSLSNESHLIVNGYANAWYINKTGSYDLFLEYFPERGFTIGKKLSIISVTFFFSGILIYYAFYKYHNRKV